jgi:plasmid stabilization system protein ParE
MKYRTIIRPEAEADIEESYGWYEDQSMGLGGEFLKELRISLSAIEQRPFSFPIVHRSIRRTLVRRFPHSFFYFIDEKRLIITACVHHKRDPQIWKRRR